MRHAFTTFALAVTPLFIAPISAYRDDSWGKALIANKCGGNAFFIKDNDADQTSTIQPGSTATVPMYYKAATPSACNPGGGSLKIVSHISPSDDLYAGASMTQFEFTPGDYTGCPGPFCQKDKVSYDISNVNTNGGSGMNGNGQAQSGLPPFMAGGLALSSPQDSSVNVECGSCINPCSSFYTGNSDNTATHATDVTNDILLTLCSGDGAEGRMMGSGAAEQYCKDGGSQQPKSDPSPQEASPQADPTSSSPPESVASPSQQSTSQSQPISSAPLEDKLDVKPSPSPEVSSEASPEASHPAAKPKVKAIKEEAEVVVTVTAWAPTVTEHVVKHRPAKEKRHEHIHAHAHQKNVKRRHGA